MHWMREHWMREQSILLNFYRDFHRDCALLLWVLHQQTKSGFSCAPVRFLRVTVNAALLLIIPCSLKSAKSRPVPSRRARCINKSGAVYFLPWCIWIRSEQNSWLSNWRRDFKRASTVYSCVDNCREDWTGPIRTWLWLMGRWCYGCPGPFANCSDWISITGDKVAPRSCQQTIS